MKFDYLLNAMECAAQSDHPFSNGYSDKRAAVIAYVRELESQVRELTTRNSELEEGITTLINEIRGFVETGAVTAENTKFWITVERAVACLEDAADHAVKILPPVSALKAPDTKGNDNG